jgi:hypothetical protein
MVTRSSKVPEFGHSSGLGRPLLVAGMFANLVVVALRGFVDSRTEDYLRIRSARVASICTPLPVRGAAIVALPSVLLGIATTICLLMLPS